jgi:hypothetical protein
MSISVKRNIVFNNDDVQLADDITIIHVEAHSEGKRDKVIQASKNNAKNTEEPKDDNPEDQQIQENEPEPHQTPESPNFAPLPSINNQDKFNQKPNDNDQSSQQYGHGQRSRPPKGAFKAINKGLAVALVIFEEEPNDEVANIKVIEEFIKDDDGCEISQLEKLGTWEGVDLPQGHMAILCNEVVRVKQGPDGKVQGYRVRVVAGGHKQVKGVNYSKTFSATAKMLTAIDHPVFYKRNSEEHTIIAVATDDMAVTSK